MKSQGYVKFGNYNFIRTKDLILKKGENIKLPNVKTLWKCYKNPSIYKQRAYKDCLSLICEIISNVGCTVLTNGISGFNCMMFTFIIYCIIDNRECIITRTKSYDKITYIKRVD